MSRCFPYRSPAYRRNVESGEAVSKSIKLVSKRERKVITEHHEYQRDKKQEKKQKRKDREKNKEGRLLIRFKCDNGDKGLLPTPIEEEAEKSDLSEEYEQPLLSQNLCYFSETFESRIKGKNDDLTSDGGRSCGNIIRICLPLQKNAEPDVSVRGEQLCSTSGRLDSSYQQQGLHDRSSQEHCSLVNFKAPPIMEETNSRLEKSPSILDFGRKDETDYCTKFHENGSPAPESLFKSLVEDWAPPPMQLQRTTFEDDDDNDWHFGAKKQKTYGHQRFKAYGGVDHESCTLWPRVCHLIEADLYALPYTIPF